MAQDLTQDRTYIGDQGSYIIPDLMPITLPEPQYTSGTSGQNIDTITLSPPCPQRMLDTKSGLHICVLNIPKDVSALDQTDGVLSYLTQQLEEQNIEPVDLVKRAWKTSEQNDVRPST